MVLEFSKFVVCEVVNGKDTQYQTRTERIQETSRRVFRRPSRDSSYTKVGLWVSPLLGEGSSEYTPVFVKETPT